MVCLLKKGRLHQQPAFLYFSCNITDLSGFENVVDGSISCSCKLLLVERPIFLLHNAVIFLTAALYAPALADVSDE